MPDYRTGRDGTPGARLGLFAYCVVLFIFCALLTALFLAAVDILTSAPVLLVLGVAAVWWLIAVAKR